MKVNNQIFRRSIVTAIGILSAVVFGDYAMAEDAYPVTITHALGETVIEEAPSSIVTIGWGNLDVPLALGIAPAGVSKATYGATDENGLLLTAIFYKTC